VTGVRIIKDRNVVRCSELDQEKTGRGKIRLRKVYMLHFFNRLRLLVPLPPVENRISRISPWPCWNVCSLILTGTTRRGRQAEKCREGWHPGDRCVRCSVLDVSLVVGVVEPVVLGVVILPGPAGDGGDGGSQLCAAHHSRPVHSPNPRNRHRTWSLHEVQKTTPRPRHPRVHMTCWGYMVAPALSISSTLQLGSPTVCQLNFEATPVNDHVALLECC